MESQKNTKLLNRGLILVLIVGVLCQFASWELNASAEGPMVRRPGGAPGRRLPTRPSRKVCPTGGSEPVSGRQARANQRGMEHSMRRQAMEGAHRQRQQRAATDIQRVYRGHKGRKQAEEERGRAVACSFSDTLKNTQMPLFYVQFDQGGYRHTKSSVTVNNLAFADGTPAPNNLYDFINMVLLYATNRIHDLDKICSKDDLVQYLNQFRGYAAPLYYQWSAPSPSSYTGYANYFANIVALQPLDRFGTYKLVGPSLPDFIMGVVNAALPN